MPLTKQQIAVIHVAKSKLALDDADYHAILEQYAGVSSSRELNETGFMAVMRRFEQLGFKNNRPKHLGTRPGMTTPKQIGMIRNLWREYKGAETDDFALGMWLERTFHVSSIRFLTYDDGQKTIGALKIMKARNFDKPKHSSQKGGGNHAHH